MYDGRLMLEVLLLMKDLIVFTTIEVGYFINEGLLFGLRYEASLYFTSITCFDIQIFVEPFFRQICEDNFVLHINFGCKM